MAEVGNLNIKVGLDSVNFNRGIKGINQQLKLAQSEFKNATSKISGFGNNLDKLKAKSNYLNKSVELQREKVKQLKQAYQDSIKETGEFSVKSQNLANQLMNADTRLNRLRADLDRTNNSISQQTNKWTRLSNKMKTVGTTMQNTGKKMQNIGSSLMMKVTAPLAGIGIASVKVASDFEASMSEVQAISGATGDTLQAMEDKAKEMGQKTSKSASESAQALKYMSLAGWDAETSMSALEPVLRLSEAGGLDLARASDLVTDSMSALGLNSNELQGYLDKVAKSQASANTSADQMLEAYIVAGGTFKNLNVPLEESSALLGTLANRGKKGSEAGNALNSIMVNLTTGAGQAGKAMNELGVNAFDKTTGKFKGMANVLKEVRDKTKDMTEEQKNQYLAMIGGKTQLDTLQALLDGVGNEYEDLKGKIKNSDGALNDMAKTMQDNLNGQLTIIKSSLEAVGLKIANTLTPYVKQLATFMQGLLDKFNNLNPVTQDMIVKIGLVVGAIAPLLLTVGTLVTIVGSAMTGLSTLGGVLAGISLPIVGLVVGVGALIATMVHLYKTNDVVRDKLNKLGEFLKGTFIQAFNQVKNKVTEFFTIFGQKVKSFMENNKPFFDNLIVILVKIGDTLASVVQNIVVPMLKTMGKLFASTLKRVWDVVSTTMQNVFNVFKGVIGLISSLIQGDWTQVWEYAKKIVVDIFKGLIDTAFTWGKNLVGMLADGVKASYGIIKDAVAGVGKTISDFLGFHSPTKKGPCSDSHLWAGNFMTMFADGINSNRSLVMSATQSVANSVKSTFDSAMSYAQNMASKISSLRSSISSSSSGGGSSSRSSRRSSTQEWAKNNRSEIERIKRELGVDHIDIQEARDRSESSSRSRSSSHHSSHRSIGSRVSSSVKKAVSSIRKKFHFHTGGFVSPKTQEMNATLKMGEFVLSRGHIDFIKKHSGNGGGNFDYERLAKLIKSVNGKNITQHVTINSPTVLSPAEIARKNKIALQQLALQL
ncbi:MAG: phage tail tape measure protein [Vallitalea sp.]|jgi:TP901 family phage tail tape measure protein|nr:phage tail tape measure protein [Vallitalea sp.]